MENFIGHFKSRWKTIRVMLEKVRVKTKKMSRKVWLIDKTKASDLTESKFYWVRALRTLFPHDLNMTLIWTNTCFWLYMFGVLSTRVLSSVTAVAFILRFLYLAT